MHLYKITKTNSGGALLFATITAFVLTMVASTLVLLSANQYKIINGEVDRIIALYIAEGKMQYAIWWANNNTSSLPAEVNQTIQVPNLTGIIIRRIDTTQSPFVPYRIEITQSY